jgi:uncharacterized protein
MDNAQHHNVDVDIKANLSACDFDEEMRHSAIHTGAVEIRSSGIHGLGVFALRHLDDEMVIGEYMGRRHPAGADLDDGGTGLTYLFLLHDGSTIDGADGGNATCFLNHSCEPNVKAVEVDDAQGTPTIVITAMRRIACGEELYLDYSLEVSGDTAEYPCHCGTPSCRGTLASPAEPECRARTSWLRKNHCANLPSRNDSMLQWKRRKFCGYHQGNSGRRGFRIKKGSTWQWLLKPSHSTIDR